MLDGLSGGGSAERVARGVGLSLLLFLLVFFHLFHVFLGRPLRLLVLRTALAVVAAGLPPRGCARCSRRWLGGRASRRRWRSRARRRGSPPRRARWPRLRRRVPGGGVYDGPVRRGAGDRAPPGWAPGSPRRPGAGGVGPARPTLRRVPPTRRRTLPRCRRARPSRRRTYPHSSRHRHRHRPRCRPARTARPQVAQSWTTRPRTARPHAARPQVARPGTARPRVAWRRPAPPRAAPLPAAPPRAARLWAPARARAGALLARRGRAAPSQAGLLRSGRSRAGRWSARHRAECRPGQVVRGSRRRGPVGPAGGALLGIGARGRTRRTARFVGRVLRGDGRLMGLVTAMTILPVGPTRPRVLVVHAGASMATRSAAIPREPYALTEPSDIPRVSATCASVMSAK